MSSHFVECDRKDCKLEGIAEIKDLHLCNFHFRFFGYMADQYKSIDEAYQMFQLVRKQNDGS